MPNQFFSPEGDLENYFVTEYWLIDQYIGDTLWTWGSESAGRLGNAVTTGNISTPVTTFAGGTNWKQVGGEIAGTHISAIKTDGTLWTWGNAAFGVLGNAITTGVRSTPVTTFAGGTNWKQVNSASQHTAAIKTDGTLWSWGNGSGGKLGNASAVAVNIGTPITTFAGGSDWKQVNPGDIHTAAIKTDGTLWIWGSGTNGQLGNAVITGSISTPVTTFAGGTNWKQVSCGGSHTAAIKTDGTLWSWGYGGNGRLGNAVITGSISTPVTTFAGGNDWKQVSCGNQHTAAIKTDGTLWTWGIGSNGRLGNTIVFGNRSTPVTTFAGGTNWKQVSCGGSHTAAIKTDGTLWTWGAGTNGQLGNAQITDKYTPVTTFAGGTNWKQVRAASTHTAAVTAGISPEYPLS
jgi:alpha-tubulin suppressor-like RCC1 family protein